MRSAAVRAIAGKAPRLLSGSNPTLSANPSLRSVLSVRGRLQASRGSLSLTALGTNPTLAQGSVAGVWAL